MPQRTLATDEASGNRTALRQRSLQRQQDATDAKKSDKKTATKRLDPAVQTSSRRQPQPPMPTQHLDKPGLEAAMQLKPKFLAPDYKGSGKLEGMVALITGGDSGIGRAVAVLMAREGANIGLAYLSEHEDAADTKQYVEAEGGQCLLIPGDVRRIAFCNSAVAKTVKKFGKLNILINNAAYQQHADTLQDISEERFDETMKTNVYGYFHMAKAAIPHLPRGGCIINTGSVTGIKGSKNLLDYSTTKGAVHAFTKALAANLLPQGIRVNAVAPGPVWTPLNPADKSTKHIAKFGTETDMHRPAQPEEISPAFVYLAAPCSSSYVTGIVLPITGSVG